MAKRIDVKGTLISNSNQWIYDYFGIEATSPGVIQKGLDEANGEDVVIYVNSGGGSVIAGHEMYTAVRSYQGNVSFEILYAGSAASVLTQAAKSVISPVGLFMIHNCSGSAYGDYRDMDKGSQLLQTINQSIRNSYKAKTSLTDEELIKLMDNETWMSADDAVKYGFVDSVMFSEQKPQDDPTTVLNAGSLDKSDFCKSVILDEKVIEKIRNEKMAGLLKDSNDGSNTPGIVTNCTVLGEINTNKNNEEVENHMTTLEEFLNQNAEANQEMNQRLLAAKDEGYNNGVTNERERIKAIDDIAKAISPDMVSDAKYVNPISAAELSLKVVSNTATAGKKYFEDAVTDSAKSGADDVPSTPSDPNDESEDEALINFAANAANEKRGGK